EAISDTDLSVSKYKIDFNIPGAGVQTIIRGSALPTISDPVLIDGTSEGINVPGAAIQLDGVSAGASANGLKVQAGSSTIRGLAINRFAGDGILLETLGGDTIQACFLGTNFGGTVALGNNLNGLEINNT